jgi:uncharacterized membrane protein YkoI
LRHGESGKQLMIPASIAVRKAQRIQDGKLTDTCLYVLLHEPVYEVDILKIR